MNQTIFKDETKNEIRFSEFRKIEAETPFKGLGIKYVASGEEVYIANNKKYSVKEGEYIIGNDFTKTIVQINNKKTVQGLCIDISESIISEVADYYDLNSNNLKEFLLSDQFFVNRYNVKNTSLGYSLIEINKKIKTGHHKNNFLHEELFYSLAESIITDQRFVFNHLNKMDFKKSSTNEEVFRLLLRAKDNIDLKLTENLSLEEISLGVGISKYHFIRLFKTIFGVSPYQYQKRKRLQAAQRKLETGNSIFETSVEFGFSDVASFTKAFKQIIGISPGNFKKSNF